MYSRHVSTPVVYVSSEEDIFPCVRLYDFCDFCESIVSVVLLKIYLGIRVVYRRDAGNTGIDFDCVCTACGVPLLVYMADESVIDCGDAPISMG